MCVYLKIEDTPSHGYVNVEHHDDFMDSMASTCPSESSQCQAFYPDPTKPLPEPGGLKDCHLEDQNTEVSIPNLSNVKTNQEVEKRRKESM